MPGSPALLNDVLSVPPVFRLLVAFALVHVLEVIVSGLWNHLRSMITGRYRIPTEKNHEQEA